MDPSHDVDRILKDWDSVTSQARRPVSPPRRTVVRSGLSGSTLAGAAVIVVVLVIAGVWIGRPGPDGGVGSVPSTSVGSSPTPTATATTPLATATVPATPPSTPVPSPLILTPTPTPTPKATPTVGPCVLGILRATTTLWEGAAGHRIAHVELTNTGSVACTVETMAQPELLGGDGTVLIRGSKPTSSESVTVAPNGTLTTLVQDGNYCGPAPVAPVTVAFVLSDKSRFEASPTSSRDTDGVPPCNGAAGSAGDIEMHPWAP